jgi:hypothetical protein
VADGLIAKPGRAARLGGLCALVLLACSGEKERPAPYSVQGKTPENPRGCRDIQSGTAVGTEIWLEEQPAGCVADGLICPLGPAFTVGAGCAPGAAAAHCVAQRWVLTCIDGGAP